MICCYCSQLYMYHSRVLKEEGAKLVRVRWYGNSLKKSALFVERKVHSQHPPDVVGLVHRGQQEPRAGASSLSAYA
jgi:hypothetical protein